MIFPLRDSSTQINAWDLCKYLSQTLTFTSYLNCIEIFEENKLQYRVSKSPQSSEVLTAKQFKELSPHGLLSLFQVEKKNMCFVVKRFSENSSQVIEEMKLDYLEATYNVHSNTGIDCISFSSLKLQAVESQMFRVLGKKFPKQTKVKLLFHKEQESASNILKDLKSHLKDGEELNDDNMPSQLHSKSLLIGISPYPNRGRVFIGFSSHQTTGCGFHISAQIIPTIERESIDFGDFYFKKWNSDVIYVAGRICRMYYNSEFGSLDTPKGVNEVTDIPKEKLNTLMLRSMTFSRSTPSTEVSQILSQAFFVNGAPIVPSISRKTSNESSYQLITSTFAFLPSEGEFCHDCRDPKDLKSL